MTIRRSFVAVVVVFALISATLVFAQRNRRSGAPFDDFFGAFGYNSFDQNNPPETEFVMARWHYTAGWGGDGWAHDYPTAEQHILQILKETSLLDTERMSYKVVELASPEIFQYPFSYVSEPGEMDLTDQEIVNLREYIDRGGFVMVDDFGGQGGGDREFQAFRSNLLRAFPERDMFVLNDDHPLLHIFYDINSLQTLHPMSGVKSVFYGYPDGKGGLAMIICYANDVGDYWEFIDEPRYPLEPSAEALKLGVNFILYAMTH